MIGHGELIWGGQCERAKVGLDALARLTAWRCDRSDVRHLTATKPRAPL